MGLIKALPLSVVTRGRATAAVLMFASQSCRGDGGPTSFEACGTYCGWATTCTGETDDDVFFACRDACEMELDSCSRGHELNAIDALMDCADRSCADSCSAHENDDCTFAWPR